MHEASKAIMRRSMDQRFATKYLVGDGIDIGAGPDSIGAYASLFPLVKSVRAWDMPDGDAMLMASVADASLDFVHSSHCLEHLEDPYVALGHWLRICRPGGYLVVIIPDEDLYEQGVFPSTFNPTHRWSFTISKRESWSPRSVNLLDLLGRFNDVADVIKVELLDHAYLYGMDRFDQTLMPVTEAAIEFVLRKRTPEDIQCRGIYPAR
ncbi:MAG: class I SAM-dependent methyltransferase [Alphaproteobacteria bacterium]|nr:class I SAM-dependent methyltransferase [Alphaproteobacteria bacterium]